MSWRRVPNHRIMIQAQTLPQVKLLNDVLNNTGLSTISIHGRMTYKQRLDLIYSFIKTNNSVMICTGKNSFEVINIISVLLNSMKYTL